MIINGTSLSMIRGDSESLTVACFQGDESRPFEAGEIVRLTARFDIDVDPPVVALSADEFPDGTATFFFDPETTNDLSPGIYVYDVQLTTLGGAIHTIVEPSEFEIRGDVTRE